MTDDQEYQFYDVSGENLEANNLLDIPVEQNNEPKTAKLGLFAAGGAALLLLIAAVLAWILFHKNRSDVILAHAIMVTLGLLFAAFAAVWALGVGKSLKNHTASNPLLTIIVFVGSIVLGGYLLASALYLWMYRCAYNNFMFVMKNNPDDWDHHFWGYDFDYA